MTENFAEFAKAQGSQLDKDALENKFDSVFSNNTVLESIKGKIPENLYDEVEKYLNNSKDSVNRIIKALNNPSKEEGAEELTEVAAKPITIMIVQMIVFMISFALLMIVVKIISSVITRTLKIVPVVGSVNTFLGAVLGFAQGVIVVLILTFIIKILISLTNNELMLFNLPTIEETYIFKHIYNFKLFK